MPQRKSSCCRGPPLRTPTRRASQDEAARREGRIAPMQPIITLIAAPGAEAELRSSVVGLGGAVDWLAPGACDLAVAEEAARAAIAARPIDIIIQPTANRRKQLLVADLE